MNVLFNALLGWMANPTYSSRDTTKRVSPRHATKKGPGRSVGSDPMRKEFAARKMPKHIAKGYVIGSGKQAERAAIGVNGIRGKSGAGR